MSVFQLTNRRALITGGSQGIGLGIAEAFAQAGADLLLVARKPAALEQARTRLERHGTAVQARSFDLGQVETIAAFFDDLVAETGEFDILVNNAAVNIRGPAEELSLESWQQVLDLNLSAVFALSQAFARQRISRARPGRILNMASLTSTQTRAGISAYTASKGGVQQLTQALAVDWASHQILVNAIAPGYIDTPLTAPLVADPEFSDWVKARCPLGRWGRPEDIAHAAVFLVSDASAFITGQTLYVDGGWLARF